MTEHYHGTPITPLAALRLLEGSNFCISYVRPDSIRECLKLGNSIMLDNGAFSVWKRGIAISWHNYYAWIERWLDRRTWAVAPDVIEGTAEQQDMLLRQWPFPRSWAAPVWHMHEPISRLEALCDQDWNRVCIGSSAQYAQVLSGPWIRQMDRAWNAIGKGALPRVHMLRGMQLIKHRWPFYSVDSTDIARNHRHSQSKLTALERARRWEAHHCPTSWKQLVVPDETQQQFLFPV